ncbi:hypothetical protein IFO69_19980 [Echinicola sp. CAU 1574]|uniref:Outer membrane protein beta-barrel domain-containing protein n=1 Tax=Echinicola arenosa TaxID=2774144 RepID=A0ABR9AT34_9BACT|nr:hypothetical protein [Echinicola arenosa]MBD8491043.1 hypothetical protein [Echinicola arenosa]
MRKILLLLAVPMLLWGSEDAQAQQAEGSYLVSGAFDLARTDAPGVIRRYQIGLEANYFHWYNISFSGGYEFNYNRPNQVTLGGRYYPLEPAFIRMRGLIGKDSDLAFGAGYTLNLSYRVRLEGMVDYYAVSNVAGLRAGISFLIN